MVNESMVARATRAIEVIFEQSAAKHGGKVKLHANDIARAVIEAMREPTEAMLLAANNACRDHGFTKASWRKVIDAGLK